MTTANSITTDRPRRTLNDSIARLDAMIDGLSGAIPEVIRDELRVSVGAAVAEGVKTALLEVLGQPDLLNLIRGLVPAAVVPQAVQPHRAVP